MKTTLLSLLLSPLLFAQSVPQDILDTGKSVSSELIEKLGKKLKQEIETGGLVKAAKFCNANAMTLTEEVSLHQHEGISLKRISLQERNAANAPTEDERKALESLQEFLTHQKLPEYFVEERERVYKYYKPLIITKELCLACHGEIEKDSELSRFMDEHYPQDKAKGYKMGELRGAVVVEIKK